MAREHCTAADSQAEFVTPNYHLRTTCEREWWFVLDPVSGMARLGIFALSVRLLTTLDDGVNDFSGQAGLMSLRALQRLGS